MKTGSKTVEWTKKTALTAAVTVMMAASTGWAGLLTVCKASGEDACSYTSIQKAVNAAKSGDVIQIMDTEVYNEQVTIDGRGEWNKPSIWDGKNGGTESKVMGGKDGITIKYAPTGGGRLFGTHSRPVIRWLDTKNVSPINNAESKNESELPGGSGNFSTCGAFRILGAKDVTVDGVEIRGGGAKPFAFEGVWGGDGTKYPNIGGNAALVIHGSGGAVIRNCVIDSGFFGVLVKDRNTGGVFGNPNRDDNDKTIPLSQFGQGGGHLIEYNKIKGNTFGMFFESCWDLGSSVRYNLIYNNLYTNWTLTPTNEFTGAGGAIFFRDVKLSPIAIYNNTFYNNTGNILGGWKKGAPHLVFNNIFGKPGYTLGATVPNGVGNAILETWFPNRLHNSVFAATEKLTAETRHVNQCNGGTDAQGNTMAPHGQQISGITYIQFLRNLPAPANGTTEVRCLPPIADKLVNTTEFKAAGGLLLGTGQGPQGGQQGPPATGYSFTSGTATTDNNIRWLETSKSIEGTEDLFESTSENSPDFLKPKWTNTNVVKFIKGQGWPEVGFKNSDGAPADLGAVPYTGRAPASVVRVKPSNVVLIKSTTTADAKYFVTVENGTFTGGKISLLRWVEPLPNGKDNDSDADPIAASSINRLPNPSNSVVVGGNSATFTFTAKQGGISEYGFFEVVVSGKDGNNDVVSDIGFLPYRKLDYSLKIEFFAAGSTTPTKTVTAGEQYRMHVTPCKGSDPSVCGSYSDNALNEISFDLQTPSAFIYKWGTETALTQEGPSPSANITGASGKDYQIYFTKAGAETIMGSGTAPQNNGGRLVFLGTADITVKPGAPHHISFINPVPKSQLSGGLPPTIFKGVPYAVEVMVQDKFDNAVDQAVSVSIKSEATAIGDVAPASATTATSGAKQGIATFTANVTGGKAKDEFDLTASATIGGSSKTDVGRLRVGKSPDRFEVFFSDVGPGKDITVYYDPTVTIEGNVGEWYKITVKVVVGDTVVTTRPNQYINVVPSTGDKMIFSDKANGTAATVFDLKNGVAEFWVSTAPDIAKDITNGSVTVYALTSKNTADVDGSIATGFRDGINFTTPQTDIASATVYGDGHGRPDSAIVRYKAGNLKGPGAKPDSVFLTWGGKDLKVGGVAAVLARDSLTLWANFSVIGNNRPKGVTSISGLGIGIMKVKGGVGGKDAVNDVPEVYDGVGPVFADSADGSGPRIVENTNEINVTLSEALNDPTKLTKILYSPGPGFPGEPTAADDGTVVSVSAATVNGLDYTLTVDPAAGVAANGWIRLAQGVVDRASNQSGGKVGNNPPHEFNRWVQLKLQVVPPKVQTAWYKGAASVGKPNFAYVVFDKGVSLTDFTGGSVDNVALPTTTADIAQYIKISGPKKDTLEINLVKALPSVAVSGSIKTGGALTFTLTYNSGTGWAKQSVTAADKAAPVLAKAVILKKGAIKSGGGYERDTLMVTYSEKLVDASLTTQRPVTIKGTAPGRPFQPLLVYVKEVTDGSYYKVSYLTDGDVTMKKPELYDSVQINSANEASIKDDKDNVQDSATNKWQPLQVESTPKWTVKVHSNPFVNEAGADKAMKVVLSPNAPGADKEKTTASATIRVFDNIGALVVDTSLVMKSDSLSWEWKGQNRKGRLVGTGTYLFKASCVYEDENKKKAQENFTNYLGVVRK